MSSFLVKHIENKKSFWIDINNGQQFEPCNIPYNLCKHGLCETLKRKVLKKIVNDNFPPLVFKAVDSENPILPKKTVSISYKDENKGTSTWTFTPYEISEVIAGLEEDLSDSKLCILVCCPRDVVKKLRHKLEGGLMEKFLGGDKHGTKRNKSNGKRRTTGSRDTIRRKNARR